ncbi:MAG TPA: hypothetical protein VN732_00320, partial [Solirubrobacterales bacterium]|nr:hypothetical protein [Solirubrobacterales bacterium]
TKIASAAVYWDDVGGIAAANADGSSPNYKYFKPPFPSDSAGPSCGLAVSPTHLYWVGSFGIGRVNLEGPATPATISPHLQQPCGVAVDGAHVYWAEPPAGKIGRANLDGSEANTDLISGLGQPCGVAVDGTHLYWASGHGIGRANLDGSQPQPNFLSTLPGGCGLGLDSQYLYWANDRAIGRVSRDGLFRQGDFIAGLDHVAGIAVDAGHVYWMNVPEGMNYGTIGRADIDGSDANRSWVSTQKFNATSVAVDARPSPPPLPLPSRPIRFGKVSHDRRAGTAVLQVFVPERGELSVISPGIGWKVDKGPEPPPYRFGSFTWRLKLWPGRTPFGKKLRTRLRHKGRAPLTLRLSYNEEGQLPLTATKQVALLQHRKAPSRAGSGRG